ncbi:MAG: 3'(2'),5'-bisphosphate nucleotidase CysQ [Longimicrobiales bacterium]
MNEHRANAELAIAAAVAAGEGIMRVFGTDMEVTHKSPDQPLTEADLTADRLLKDMLTSARPGYGWLSEETADSADRLQRAFVWVVDPIDGTRSFVARRPEFSVSVALAEHGEPVVGVVLNPATGELFWAVRGSGAWQRTREGDRRIAVRKGSGARAVLLASRGEIAKGEFLPYGEQWQIEGIGSTAYKMARVAAGLADGFLSRGPKSEWDVCAGALLVREAGGEVTDANGDPITFNRADANVRGVLCATAEQHPMLLHMSRAQDHRKTGEKP